MLREVKRLIEEGFSAILLRERDKMPIDNKWSTQPVQTYEQLEERWNGHNVGVRLGEPSRIGDLYLHVVDVDIRDLLARDAALEVLERFLPGAADMPTVLSGSGGGSRHIYFLTDQPFPSKKLAHSKRKVIGLDGKEHWAWELELFGTGKQVVLPPSIHPDTGKEYRWLHEFYADDAPEIDSRNIQQWVNGLDRSAAKDDRRAESRGDFLLEASRRTDLPIADIKNILNNLPEDWCDDYHQWLHVGMALHHEFQGDDEGLELWHWYSEPSGKYDSKVLDDKWRGFGRTGGEPVRFKTLIYAANRERADRRVKEASDENDKNDSHDWAKTLEVNQYGVFKPTVHNITTILRNDRRFRNSLAYNEFRNTIVLMRDLKVLSLKCTDPVNGTRWIDTYDRNLRLFLETRKQGYGMPEITVRNLIDAIDIVAYENRFHPVRKYLNSLEWDGVPRIERLFVDYLGSPDDAYHRETARLLMIGAASRAYEPGHKFDFTPIILGEQGIRKTTFAETLAVDQWWFGALAPDFSDNKKMVESMQGKWILEIPELAGFDKKQIRSIKHFFSQRKETARLSYDRRGDDYLRACVYIGTTNDAMFLIDETGNRRYWPIVSSVNTIDIEKLRRNLDQLWAEATAVYHRMRAEQPTGDLPLYITDPEIIAVAQEIQARHMEPTTSESWATTIKAWLDTPVGEHEFVNLDNPPPRYRIRVTLLEIWKGAFDGQDKSYNTLIARNLGDAMRQLRDEWKMVGVRDKSKTWERVGLTKAPIFQKSRGEDLI